MLKNKFYLKHKYLAIFLCFLLFHHALLEFLKFWGSDEIDPDEPVVLEAIECYKY